MAHLVEFTHPERVEQKLPAFGVPPKVDFLPFGTQCKGREYNSDFWMSEKPDIGVFGRQRPVAPRARNVGRLFYGDASWKTASVRRRTRTP
ncbi:hypothetical protein NE236_07905 [Actinoallomurus purpureus]|uniref:hypothetical protein n=1 Tax=Actinoallomurus purpureus TaxID=478114 RepID=UPI002093FA01|nr:hypothetical protein [Actinoallomurus purpureus]MCO6004902.1 hypothetical protein [Actinoallomurus purpureus]